MYSIVLALTLFHLAMAQNRCFIAHDKGNGNCGIAGKSQFYFDSNTKRCQPFYYKGCGGNENRFDSRDACEEECAKATVVANDAPVDAVCASGAYAAGATSGGVVQCSQCPNGYVCENNQCCPTKEFTCSLDYDAGKFATAGKHTPRYFYSREYNNCMLFTFYGSHGNANNFAHYNDCKNFCV